MAAAGYSAVEGNRAAMMAGPEGLVGSAAAGRRAALVGKSVVKAVLAETVARAVCIRRHCTRNTHP